MNSYLLFAYAIWNTGVFLLYGIDKIKAKTNAWRIPEKTLIMCAVLFGAVGAFAGMKAFRHKTRHTKFRILIPFLAVINVFIIAALGLAPEKAEEIIHALGIYL